VTPLRFPDEVAVGEVGWEDAWEPGGWGHLLAIGVVEIPDGMPVDLAIAAVAEVGVYGPGRAARVTWDQGPARLRHLWITLGWLDDDARSVAADLPALESLQLYGGSFTRHAPAHPGALTPDAQPETLSPRRSARDAQPQTSAATLTMSSSLATSSS
jgi:hypothetical protein